jgi:hypothetical protein
MTDKLAASGIKFSPTIELGHVLQALVMLIGIGGWALAGYYTIDRQLSQQGAKMELFQQRLSAYENNANELRDNFRTSVTETRVSLSKISDQIADLRTLVAGQGRIDVPHR